jgi:hypothetical protein
MSCRRIGAVLIAIIFSAQLAYVSQQDDDIILLKKGFAQLVEAHRTRNWPVAYKLLISHQRYALSLDEFTKLHSGQLKNRYEFISMLGISIDDLQSKIYGSRRFLLITGCAEFKQSRKRKNLTTITEAVLEDDGWKFSGIELEGPIDGQPQSCDPKKYEPFVTTSTNR